MSGYRSYAQAGYVVGGVEMDVFGTPVDVGERAYVMPACRSIEITPQVRAMDAAQVAARVFVSAWTIKGELRAENLRTMRQVPVKAVRMAETRMVVVRACRVRVRAVAAPSPMCLTCGRRMYRGGTQTLCSGCRRIAARAARCRQPPQCVKGCGRMAAERTQTGLCKLCMQRAWRAARPPVSTARPVEHCRQCSHTMATGPQRRTDGLCGKCGSKIGDRWRLSNYTTCKLCPKQVSRWTKTGLCPKCFAVERARKQREAKG